MTYQALGTYIAFGCSLGVVLYAMVMSGHLWKPRFFKQLLVFPSLPHRLVAYLS